MRRAQRPRVLLLIPHLGGGGAEMVIEILARFLNPVRYDIHLCLITQPLKSVDLPSYVTVHVVKSTRVRNAAFKLTRLIRKIRPGVILSGIAHLNLLVLLLRPLLPAQTRILVRHNGELSTILAAGSRPRLSRAAYSFAYGRADRVICQTHSMAREIHDNLSVSTDRLITLRNPISLQIIRTSVSSTESPWTGPGPRLLAMGRLAPEKGFDLLLDTFANVSIRFPLAELMLVGAGRCESDLKRRMIALGIESKVHLMGYRQNPAEFFPGASLFVLSSRSEGIPNALLEAAAAGLPIVATPASSGLVDLLRDKEGIFLAAETSSIALQSAMEQALRSISPGQRYPHRWIEEFNVDQVIPAYEDAIDRALQVRS